MRCPRCGALNPQDAPWCDQCYQTFDSGTGEPAPPASPARQADSADISPATLRSPDPMPTGPTGRGRPAMQGRKRDWESSSASTEFVVKEEENLSWRCKACDSVNPIELDVCPTCGSSLFDLFGAAKENAPLEPRDPRLAVFLSIVPGGGHLYLGRSGEGGVRMLLALWWFGFSLMIQGPSLFFIRTLFLLAGTGLMIVSALDAYNVAIDPRAGQVLDRRVILFSSLALMSLMVIGLMIAFLRASR